MITVGEGRVVDRRVWVEDRWWVWMAMIGVTTDLRGKLISPRGPSGGRYSFGGSIAAGRWTDWGSLGSK